MLAKGDPRKRWYTFTVADEVGLDQELTVNWVWPLIIAPRAHFKVPVKAQTSVSCVVLL